MDNVATDSRTFSDAIKILASTPPMKRDCEVVALNHSKPLSDVATALNAELERRQHNGEPANHYEHETPRLAAVSRCMKDIEAQSIEWLWRGRIPTKLVVLAGNPGLGKSQVSIAIAATVSVGGRWPDMTPCERGSVLFICGEDDASDTIKPRLEAAGADVSKIHIIDALVDCNGKEQQWVLDDGVSPLRDMCGQLRDVKLIVIDPITAYTGKRDSHNTADVRGLLAPLMALADEYKITVMAISHLNKSVGGDAITRVTGSGAYVAASRVSFIVGPHPDDEDAQCIATLKTNLSSDKTGIGYKVVSATSNDGIETSRVEWIDGVIDVDANEMLAPKRNTDDDIETKGRKGDALAFLMDMLKDGPKPSKTVYSEGEAQGIAERTLKRAKGSLEIESYKPKGKPEWHMRLPSRIKPDSAPDES